MMLEDCSDAAYDRCTSAGRFSSSPSWMAHRDVVKSIFSVKLSMDKLLHARQEAAQLLSVSLRKIDDLIATRKLKTVRVGRRNFVAHAELARFAQNGTRKRS